jgi:hypothetical protein
VLAGSSGFPSVHFDTDTKGFQMDRRLLDEDEIMQLCFVTDDVQKSAKWFSDLTGKPIPSEGKAAEPHEAQALYLGKPAAVGCRIIMFKFGNIDFEFLQPGPEKSAWRDVLEEKGPGFHHFAFRTRNSPSATPISRARATNWYSAASLTAAVGAMRTTIPLRNWGRSLNSWSSIATRKRRADPGITAI